MPPNQNKQIPVLERFSIRATRWIGSTESLAIHTFLFATAFVSVFLGVGFDKVLLVLTTIVSLEAIYLSIFIQMSVNRQEHRLHEVSDDIDQIHEHVEDIQENVGEIQEDVEEIQEDVEGIEKDVEEIQEDVEEIQEDVEDIGEEVEDMGEEDEDEEKKYERIQENLALLMNEIASLRKAHSQSKPEK